MKKIYAVNTNKTIMKLGKDSEIEMVNTKRSFTLHKTKELAMKKVDEMKANMWKFISEENYGGIESLIISELDKENINNCFSENNDSLAGGWAYYRHNGPHGLNVFPGDRVEIRGYGYYDFNLRIDISITEHESED